MRNFLRGWGSTLATTGAILLFLVALCFAVSSCWARLESPGPFFGDPCEVRYYEGRRCIVCSSRHDTAINCEDSTK